MVTLVTGGAGFIGSHLVEELIKHNRTVVVIDDLSTGKLENLPSSEKLKVIVGSITDVELLERLFEKYKFGVVFHLAAVASVAKSVESPIATHRVNFDGTLYLLELSRKYNVERFIFASSAAVYGNLPELPKREDMPAMPVTPYGVDKFSSERYVVNSYYLYGLRTTALRFFNVYGKRQDPSSPYSGVISIFIDRALRFLRGEKVTIDIFGDGKQTRDFIYVKDVVKALLLVEKDERAVGEVFNVGTGKETSLLELLDAISSVAGCLPPVRFLPPREGDIKRSVADISKLRTPGFSPSFSLEEGLKKTIEWEKQR
jgi:UDP-glucose 4-epimerase